jgi:glutamate/tyrosine decarboxylase-like PLP-dependent enzyme
MYLFLLFIVLAMLRNAAGAVGIILAGGSQANSLAGTLSGQGIKANTGSFSFAGNSVKLG